MFGDISLQEVMIRLLKRTKSVNVSGDLAELAGMNPRRRTQLKGSRAIFTSTGVQFPMVVAGELPGYDSSMAAQASPMQLSERLDYHRREELGHAVHRPACRLAAQ